jgi:hypothetical protein
LPVDKLFKKIIELSSKVEELLKTENEAECESLLAQRQSLLEQLAEDVEKLTNANPSDELSAKYYDFLKSIQKRDILSIEFALKQRDEILVKRTTQEKGKKAIKAYQKLIL